jgi:membrane fusion protein, heavy metal efflux system
MYTNSGSFQVAGAEPSKLCFCLRFSTAIWSLSMITCGRGGLLAALFSLIASSAVAAKDVAVTATQVERLQINIQEVRKAETETVALLPGTVTPAMNAEMVATAPFAGTLVQLRALPGQKIKKGEPLATVSSRELLEALGQVAQSEAELQMAEAVASRKKMLVEKNLLNSAMAEEAAAQVNKIKAVIEQHKRTASIGNIVVGEGGQYVIPAPVDGQVVEARAKLGDKLEAMSPVVSIAASPELWVQVQVPADLVPRIRPGDKLQIIGGPQGTVISIGGSLDPMTRSASLVASISENSGLMPGQMVTVSIVRKAEIGGLSVPSAAVARIDGRDSVFVRTDAGFTVVPVTLRGRSDLVATISGDIASNAKVASSGLPQLEQMLAGE